MCGECAVYQGLTGVGQMDNARAAISLCASPLYQTAFLKPVNSDSHRAAGESDLFPDLVHAKGAFMEKCFQNAEIGQTQVKRRDVPFGILADGGVRLPKNQPEVDSTL